MKQITIVAQKHLGLLAQVTEALANQNVNIENIHVEAFADNAVIIIIVDKYDVALQIIHQLPEMQAISEDAILIHLENEAGALAKIARRFTDAQIGIRSMRFIQRDEHTALVAISTERSEEALKLVADVLVAQECARNNFDN